MFVTKNRHDHETARLNGSLFDALTKSAEWEAKFKKAVTDLEGKVRENEGLLRDAATRSDELRSLRQNIAELHAEINNLTPDAQKWRNSLKRSRDRKAGKKGVA